MHFKRIYKVLNSFLWFRKRNSFLRSNLIPKKCNLCYNKDICLLRGISMKKIFISILSILLISALSGCSNLDKNPVVLTLWHNYNNEQFNVFESTISDFNQGYGKENNIQINAISKGYNSSLVTALLESATNELRADPFPEMFFAYSDTSLKLDQLGKVAALDEYFSERELNEYFASFIEEGRFQPDNSLKLFPVAKATEVFMLNKTDWDLFVNDNPDKNLSLSNLSTFEGLIETAQIYYEWCGKSFYGRDSLSNYFVIGAKQLGIDLFTTNDEGKFVFNFNKEVFRKLWESYYIPYINGYFVSAGKFRTSDIQANTILCYTGSSSSATYFPSKVVLSDNVEYPITCYVANAPQFKDGGNYAVQQGAGISVAKSDKKTEEACVKFLKWFTEKNNNTNFTLKTSYLPVKTESINDISTNSEDLKPIARDALKITINTFKNKTLYTNMGSNYGDSIRAILDTHIDSLAKENRKKILEMVTQGVKEADAVAQFSTDSVFESWYASLQEEINKIIV